MTGIVIFCWWPLVNIVTTLYTVECGHNVIVILGSNREIKAAVEWWYIRRADWWHDACLCHLTIIPLLSLLYQPVAFREKHVEELSTHSLFVRLVEWCVSDCHKMTLCGWLGIKIWLLTNHREVLAGTEMHGNSGKREMSPYSTCSQPQ